MFKNFPFCNCYLKKKKISKYRLSLEVYRAYIDWLDRIYSSFLYILNENPIQNA